MQPNVACAPKSKREFCRDHHLTFLCSSFFTKRSVFKKEGEVWLKKITNNNFRTITQGLLSSHRLRPWFTLYGWLIPSCLSVYYYIFTREVRSRESVARVRLNTNNWGQVKVYGPLPTLLLGFVFFRVVFTCGLFSFLPLVSMTMRHCNASLEPPKYKEQKKQTQGARKSSRLQLCRPKLIVKFPKCWIMLKD